MTDIIVSNVTKAFGTENNILDGISFEVERGRHLGVLGRNGAGKTTLFKLLTGELEPDTGHITIGPGCTIGLVSQMPVFPAGFDVEQVIRGAFCRIEQAERDLRELEKAMLTDSGREVLDRYQRAQQRFEAFGGYDMEVEFAKVCNGLSISGDMLKRKFSTLSGGEQTRVNLAKLLLERTDILLMDEPTNHLDMKNVEWLEEYLQSFRGTVLVISHDRYFLDRVVDGVIELEGGKAEYFKGNYSKYSEEKERRFNEELKRWQRDSKKLEQLQQAADKLHLWAFMGNDKLHKRAFSMEKRMEKLKSSPKPRQERELKGRFNQVVDQADIAVTAKGLKKAFGEKVISEGCEFIVKPGEKIAIVGDNGAGKSTFIKMIIGQLQPDAGYARLGPAVRLAYLPQKVSFEAPHETLVDTVTMGLHCSVQEARDRLGAFNFRGEDVFKTVGSLSGGEQSRLRLCLLMSEKTNLLILDEPTNHLDIASRKWIENAVADFEGTLIFVSHDRYFVSLFAERIWELEDGRFNDYRCSFEDYRLMKAAQRQTESEKNVPAEKKTKQTGYKSVRDPAKAVLKRISDTEKKIAAAEEEIAALDAAIDENASDYVKLTELFAQKEEKNAALEELYALWEELTEQSESM
ncbi:MAG: ABC-F family ATP-binding cassette domain-containing protein [Oscillospiraceae bacterium]|nr:ABC-F family ATP-binding cassette domain-containing protein [Oscillospiraceae bacterium]